MVTALYRRYRPEAFAEMIGQSQVTDPLMTALRTGRVGHAYLFSGPRGCGKTTSARILARCLNCAEGPTDTPCGTCPSCVELSRDGGGSLDVVEIDAASHGGVDDARDLRERAVFAPARDRFKIFIIDEAHMVTPGGFNALLKIVEEPPPHVKFVFATTEPDKVIGTIRSRTHHYPFRLIAPATLIDYVQTLCDSEGVDVEAGVLPLVVRAGGGSVRDTLSILDQLIAGSEDGRVTKARAAGLLGFTHGELLDDVVAALGSKDSAAAFRATDRVVQTGQDPRRFVEDLLERLRDLIVVGATNVQGAAAVFRGVPEDQLQRMFEQARVFRPGELSTIADTVSAALDHMAGATAPRLQLELMIARALVQIGGESAAADAAGAVGVAASAAGPSAPARQNPAASPTAREHAPGQPAVAPQHGSAGASATRPQQADQATQSAAETQPAGAQPAAPQSAGAQPAGTDTSGAASALNAAEAARAAREFLRTDSAGAASFGRPVTDVLGMIKEPQAPSAADPAPADRQQPVASGNSQRPAPDSPQQSASKGDSQRPSAPEPGPRQAPEADAGSGQASGAPQQAQPPVQPEQAPAAQAPAVQDGATNFEELAGMWPDLLEEILEADRDAWNAVHSVQPLAFEGDVLTLGFASESDLTVFKASGAGPLRETILAAFGVRVRYVPKAVPAPSGQTTAPAQTQGAARETGGSPQAAPAASEAAEEPRPGASPAPIDSAASARQAERPRTDPAPGTQQAPPRVAAQTPAPAPAPAEAVPAATEPAAVGSAPATTEPASAVTESASAPDEDPLLKAAAARVAALQGRVSASPRTPATPQASEKSPSRPPAPSAGAAAPSAGAVASSAGAVAPSAGAVAPSAGAAAPSAEAVASSAGAPDPRAFDPGEYPSHYEDGPFADEDPYGGQTGDPYLNAQRSDPASARSEARRAAEPKDPTGPVSPSARPAHSGTATATGSAAGSAVDDALPAVGSRPPAPTAAAGGGTASGTRTSGDPATSAEASQGAEAPVSGVNAPVSGMNAPVSGANALARDEDAPAKKNAPSFTRYGEAVVREVLGARFIEERPLPETREG